MACRNQRVDSPLQRSEAETGETAAMPTIDSLQIIIARAHGVDSFSPLEHAHWYDGGRADYIIVGRGPHFRPRRSSLDS
jgi:hypothetical protein